MTSSCTQRCSRIATATESDLGGGALSLGDWIALDYAVRCPGRVASLVLICPAGVGRETVSIERNVPRAEVRWLAGVGYRVVGQTAPILEFLRRACRS